MPRSNDRTHGAEPVSAADSSRSIRAVQWKLWSREGQHVERRRLGAGCIIGRLTRNGRQAGTWQGRRDEMESDVNDATSEMMGAGDLSDRSPAPIISDVASFTSVLSDIQPV